MLLLRQRCCQQVSMAVLQAAHFSDQWIIVDVPSVAPDCQYPVANCSLLAWHVPLLLSQSSSAQIECTLHLLSAVFAQPLWYLALAAAGCVCAAFLTIQR
jgi:hypothetical protein